MTKMLPLKIKDKYTHKDLVVAYVSSEARADKVTNIAVTMLTTLYAMGRKGKAQYWEIPERLAYSLQLGLGWKESFKKHEELWKIKTKWLVGD